MRAIPSHPKYPRAYIRAAKFIFQSVSYRINIDGKHRL